MNYQQEIANWSAQGEMYRRRDVTVEAVEARYEARESARINGAIRVAGEALDGLHGLHGAAAARVENAPRFKFGAYQIVSTVEMGCCERIARYLLG